VGTAKKQDRIVPVNTRENGREEDVSGCKTMNENTTPAPPSPRGKFPSKDGSRTLSDKRGARRSKMWSKRHDPTAEGNFQPDAVFADGK